MGSNLDPLDRRKFIKGLGVVGGVAAIGSGVGVGVWRANADGSSGPSGLRKRPVAGSSKDRPSLDVLAQNTISGGPGKDGIPPIDSPTFIRSKDVDFLEPGDPVFGLVYRGEVRAYPQLVLVWHEIVNDTIGGEPVSITYCPLTGTVVAFRGRSGGEPLTFGTTGQLVNSNLLMYDRVAGSQWPQLLGEAINGRLKGRRLAEIPLDWASWQRWKRRHPDTTVLSTDTGHVRSYGSDPYGSYNPPAGYYSSDSLFFPVLSRSKRFGDKEVVVGVKAGTGRLAIRKKRIRTERVLQTNLDGIPLVAMWDDRLATARVFVRRAGGESLDFPSGEPRDASGSEWDPTGRAVSGPRRGQTLRTADYIDSMWFAWYAFYPDTRVVV